jgi:hypothetical protein
MMTSIRYNTMTASFVPLACNVLKAPAIRRATVNRAQEPHRRFNASRCDSVATKLGPDRNPSCPQQIPKIGERQQRDSQADKECNASGNDKPNEGNAPVHGGLDRSTADKMAAPEEIHPFEPEYGVDGLTEDMREELRELEAEFRRNPPVALGPDDEDESRKNLK